MTEIEGNSPRLVAQTSAIVSAFVGNNAVSSDDLIALIGIVHKALVTADAPGDVPADAPIKLTAAQIRKSVTPDALISFEDGRPYKALKRHLTMRGMTVAEYKAKWGLPKNYPTTAATYSASRSAMAKALGLGRVNKVAVGGAVTKTKTETETEAKAKVPSPSRRRRAPSRAAEV